MFSRPCFKTQRLEKPKAKTAAAASGQRWHQLMEESLAMDKDDHSWIDRFEEGWKLYQVNFEERRACLEAIGDAQQQILQSLSELSFELQTLNQMLDELSVMQGGIAWDLLPASSELPAPLAAAELLPAPSAAREEGGAWEGDAWEEVVAREEGGAQDDDS
ncbi:maker352 [Drosophila busckii]|uniref:Maker352 n=1 Tax=Drosophila busckii TaxID=30019 RepID=A0A0M4FB30_DROBS|nr:maker352 [Drosophila busckii]